MGFRVYVLHIERLFSLCPMFAEHSDGFSPDEEAGSATQNRAQQTDYIAEDENHQFAHFCALVTTAVRTAVCENCFPVGGCNL